MQNRKLGLDYMRATAIGLVLVAHTGEFFFAGHRNITYPLGTLAVEIFFVLSGYLIGGIFLASIRKHGNRIDLPLLRDFWVRRWLRTLPNYVLFVGVYWALAPVGLPTIAQHLTFAQNIAWTNPGWFNHSWSLAIEEWFYLTMPLAIVIAWLVTGRMRVAFVATILIFATYPLILRATYGVGTNFGTDLRRWVIFRPDALMYGMFVAAAAAYRPSAFAKLDRPAALGAGLLVAISATAILVARYGRNGEVEDFAASPFDGLILVGMNIGSALCLPWLTSLRWSESLLSRMVLRTSLWSYSLYLCHIAVFLVVRRLMEPAHVRPKGTIMAIVSLTLAFALSAGLYRFFELPILRLRDRLTLRRQRLDPLAVATPI